jgi:hypothetical protein
MIADMGLNRISISHSLELQNITSDVNLLLPRPRAPSSFF